MKIKIQKAQMHKLKFQSHYMIILSTDFSEDKVSHGVHKAPACPPSSITLAMELFNQILAYYSVKYPWGSRAKEKRK